jgi:uncharacterized protein (DUF433 family)
MRNSAELKKARALVVEDPEILSGTPVIRNTRIPVYDVAASVAARLPLDRILEDYPGLTGEKWSSLPHAMRPSTRLKIGRATIHPRPQL